MNRKIFLAASAAAVVMLAGCTQKTAETDTDQANAALRDRASGTPSASAVMQRVEDKMANAMDKVAGKYAFKLAAQNSSGQDGWAVLEDMNGKTKVTLYVKTADTAAKGATAAAEPAHIHIGSCPAPGAVKYPLKDVVQGKSENMLDVKLADLKTMGALAVNVHKSAEDMKTYVSCGNLDFAAFDKAVSDKMASASAKASGLTSPRATGSAMASAMSSGKVMSYIAGTSYDGVLTIAPGSGKTTFTVEDVMVNASPDKEEVVNLIKGTCGDPKDVVAPFTATRDHVKTLVQSKDWETLKAEKDGLAVVVTKAKAAAKDYKACVQVVVPAK
jgi:hypothetical protein